MTQINHYVSQKYLNAFGNRENPKSALANMTQQYYARSIVDTEDMISDGVQLRLNCVEGVEQAAKQMGINIMPTYLGYKERVIYVPLNVFQEMTSPVSSVGNILGGENGVTLMQGDTLVLPMISDKDLFLYRRISCDRQQLEDETGKIKDFFEREHSPTQGTKYGGLIVPSTNLTKKDPVVTVEGYDKGFRTDPDGDFQRIITKNASRVTKAIQAVGYTPELKVRFDLSGGENFHYV